MKLRLKIGSGWLLYYKENNYFIIILQFWYKSDVVGRQLVPYRGLKRHRT